MLGLVLALLPDVEPMAPRIGLFAVGFVLITIGIVLVIVPEIGPGRPSSLMLAVPDRGHALAPARTGIELVCVAVGLAMGGQVGAGTLVFAVLIGPALRRTLTFAGYDADAGRHPQRHRVARRVDRAPTTSPRRRRRAGEASPPQLPAGEVRDRARLEMAEAVAVAIRTKKHLAVQAGTGTGKTLAYLVPADPVRQDHGGRHGHEEPAGPAGRQGPARSSRRTSTTRSPGRC